MACKKQCSGSRTKWVLIGSASVVLVFAFGLILSFVLQQRTQPGRGRSDSLVSHPTSPQRLCPQRKATSIFPSSSTRLHLPSAQTLGPEWGAILKMTGASWTQQTELSSYLPHACFPR